MGGGWVVVKVCSAGQREARCTSRAELTQPLTFLKDVGILVFRKVTPHEIMGKRLSREKSLHDLTAQILRHPAGGECIGQNCNRTMGPSKV